MLHCLAYRRWTGQSVWKDIDGFSCVNTRLAFDTEILLNNNKNEKVIFDLWIDSKKQTKRISTKILKMDDNNQYGQAMTKSLPYSCINKKEHPPSLRS